MAQRISKVQLILLGVLLGMLVSLPVFAGSSVIGSVAGNTNATLSGQPILPNTTVYSGDSLQVQNGVAIVAMNNGGRITFGRDTAVSFLRESTETTVLMNGDAGDAMLYHPAESETVQIKAGDVTVSAVPGFLTEGEVAMADGSVVVSSREGTLRVHANGRDMEVGKGKTMKLSAKSAKTAGSPQGAVVGGVSAMNIATIGVSGVGAVLGGFAVSRAGSATTAANAASSYASSAMSTAAAAGVAAGNAANVANSVGCALNTFNHTVNPTSASPYTPGSGFTCSPGGGSLSISGGHR